MFKLSRWHIIKLSFIFRGKNMDFQSVMKALEGFGNEQTRKVLRRHGARDPFFGVKLSDMKGLVKKINKDHELSLALFNTGNSDAMYMAGLIADEQRITQKELQHWAEQSYWYMLSENTVGKVAAESPHGWKLALKWIDDKRPNVATSGWTALASMAMTIEDDRLDLKTYAKLLKRVEKEIHQATDRVPYAMNGFVISVGAYIKSLSDEALSAADTIGKVEVDMGATECKVPLASEYIPKTIARGSLGKKRKQARC